MNPMETQNYVNQKLEFVEELVVHTKSHVFLTGRAGTGKTTFLKNLRNKTSKRMAVVAPTGVAAVNAGGQTIHSFFQLSLGPQIPQDLQLPSNLRNRHLQAYAKQFQKIRKNKLQILQNLDLLIIDEISMVRADILDAIDSVLRRSRHSNIPFGGVQLLMIGDVHQLAPVAKPEEWELLAPFYNTPYFFGSYVLNNTQYLCVELDHIYRQHDLDFINLLNKIRDERMDLDCIRILNSRYNPTFKPKKNEGYITLTTHNYQADQINETKLKSLKTKKLIFEAKIEGTFPENLYPTKETLELKKGAQVMFIKNDSKIEKEYYNGKIGILVDYDETDDSVTVQCGGQLITVSYVVWDNTEYQLNEETNKIEEVIVGHFHQIPLRLAWAVTIHKSQGLTFDKLIVDAGSAFAHGQVYVALSRCTTLDGLVLKTRLSPETLINDFNVDLFVDHMPEKEPSREKVDMLRHQFELESMLEIFDFQEIYRDFGKILSFVNSNELFFDRQLPNYLTQCMKSMRDNVCEVGEKFSRQIRQQHNETILCAQNPKLQERISKGSTYFLEQLESVFGNMNYSQFQTDNPTLNERMQDTIYQLQLHLHIKQKALECCENGFSSEAYQNVKISAKADLKLQNAEQTDSKTKKQDFDKKNDKSKLLKINNKLKKLNSYTITKEMTDSGMSVDEIAKEREMAMNTIYGHLARLVAEGFYDASKFVEEGKIATIKDYFESTGDPTLSPAREVLGEEYQFWELRIVLEEVRRNIPEIFGVMIKEGD